MTCLKSTLPVSGNAHALRTLPQPLTAPSLLEIEHAVLGTLAILGRELFGVGVGMAPERHASRPNAGDLEYASWMPDPGAIEVASWKANLPGTIQERGLHSLQPSRSNGGSV